MRHKKVQKTRYEVNVMIPPVLNTLCTASGQDLPKVMKLWG